MSLQPIEGPLGTKRAAHLLRRLAFGATPQQIADFAERTIDEALEVLFADELPEAPPPLDPLTGETWIGQTPAEGAGSEESALQDYLKSWWLGQMLSAGVEEENSLGYAVRENIVFFYHTLFTTKQSVVSNSRALYYQLALFRLFARDDLEFPLNSDIPEDPFGPEFNLHLKALTERVCIDNAMLRFLDGNLNVDGNPNENYARELLELYSVGRGLEGNLPDDLPDGDYGTFTEEDVQAAARVLSGWQWDRSFNTLDELTNLPIGRTKGGALANRHDNTVKVFSERLGNAVVTPSLNPATEESARQEITDLVEAIYDQEETTRHICRRLYRYFVHFEITPELDDSLIAELSTILREYNFRVVPTLKVLISSEYFFGNEEGVLDDMTGSIIKSPLDLVVGTMRTIGYEMNDPSTDPEGFYSLAGTLRGHLSEMGLPFLDPFEVAGYPGYHQFPLFHRNWISPNYLAQRYDFIQNLFASLDDLDDIGESERPLRRMEVLNWVEQNVEDSIASDARTLLHHLAQLFLPNAEGTGEDGELTEERINYFLFSFLGDADPEPEEAWATRWSQSNGRRTVSGQLKSLFNAMLQSPEHQLK
ncbi:MAG TPA: DUF1800 domain-containing protein [Cytophagales bacterium]|nr:DUF1800 domain-containing protein [Cytophagales bacterium]HAP62608.1 DUF1800 domain-containing protein [Cytophagales bacterium]